MVILMSTCFLDVLGNSLYDLQKAGHFCDLYLKCAEEQDVVVHTCVAAAASPFIKSILDSVNAGGTRITSTMGYAISVPAVKSEVMAMIAQFMYTGRVDVKHEDLVQLLNTADYLEIEALMELCRQEIKSELSTQMSESEVEPNEPENNPAKGKIVDYGPDAEGGLEIDQWEKNLKSGRIDGGDVTGSQEVKNEGLDDSTEDNHSDDGLLFIEKELMTENDKKSNPEIELEYMSDLTVADSDTTVLRRGNSSQTDLETKGVTKATAVDYPTPVRFSKRTRGAERTKILDLIKKKSKVSNKKKNRTVEKTKEICQESLYQCTRIVTEEEERELFDGAHYSCPMCERIDVRKVSWVFHLEQAHEFEVESVTKMVSEEQLASVVHLEFDLANVMLDLESQDTSELSGDFNATELDAVIRLTKAQRHRRTRAGNCPICDKFFKHDALLEDHVKKHSDRKPYKCNLCVNTYATRSSYEEHMEMHMSGGLKFKCAKCSKSFASARRLLFHTEYNHSTGSIACHLCDKIFTNKLALKYHSKQVHEVGNFTCDVCDKTLTAARRKEHMNLHTGEDLFKCDMCDAVYKQKTSLANHRRTKHGKNSNDSKVHQCSECELKFSTKQSLEKHLLRHSGNKRFTCSTCGQQFYTKGELDQHEGYHLDPNSRPWTCSICRKCFTREYSLKCHMLVHSTDKPFTCEYCGKKFRWKNKKKEHVRIHTGEKPFQCRLCPERFPDCALRRHHEKKMHSDEIASNPDAIPKSTTRSGARMFDRVQRALIGPNYAAVSRDGLRLQDLSAVEVNPQKEFSFTDNFITISHDRNYPLLSSADIVKGETERIKEFIRLDKSEDSSQVQIATIENSGDSGLPNFVVVQNPGSFYVTETSDEGNVAQIENKSFIGFVHDGQTSQVQILTE